MQEEEIKHIPASTCVKELLWYINDLDKSDEYRSFLLKLEKEIYENKHFTTKNNQS